MNYFLNLSKKIINRDAVVGIIGIGYVGSALAQGTSVSGFKTIGFTRSAQKAKKINSLCLKNYRATSDISKVSRCDIICICVPTPIHNDKTPDLEPLESSMTNVANNLRPGQLFIIESTIAPGTTRNIALQILRSSGLNEEQDFFLSFSPERVDPGNKDYTIINTPKVISGLSDLSLRLTREFYSTFIDSVVPVSSLETAEMTKLLENTFRFINISFMNELLSYTNTIGINLWEVIAASSTKPFGFLAHFPGPGIGGHCIPVDPYYLLADAQAKGVQLTLLEQAGKVNDEQPDKIVRKTVEILKLTNGKKTNHEALVLGVSYKPDIDDIRESPSVKILDLLEKHGVSVSYHDPFVPKLNGFISQNLSDNVLKSKDIIVIATPHSSINYSKLVSVNKPILDTKNILKNFSHPHIYRI